MPVFLFFSFFQIYFRIRWATHLLMSCHRRNTIYLPYFEIKISFTRFYVVFVIVVVLKVFFACVCNGVGSTVVWVCVYIVMCSLFRFRLSILPRSTINIGGKWTINTFNLCHRFFHMNKTGSHYMLHRKFQSIHLNHFGAWMYICGVCAYACDKHAIAINHCFHIEFHFVYGL